MFNITDNKGFHMTFENGWTLSVQFGSGNYCDNYNHSVYSKEPIPPSRDAEIAAWNDKGEWMKVSEYGEVLGNVTPDMLVEYINKVKAL